MPKSKRNKTVDLTKTKKHGLEGKKELYKKIQANVENYAHVFVFAVNDMRNSKMKNVREQWKHSRFCIGKNKVMAMALGRTSEEEYRPNLHKIGQMLVGERGLLFTNQSVDEVTSWFQSYSVGDYARSGNTATEDVILPEGPLAQFPHNLESYLRQLGLPTTLKKGVIHLIKEHVVCREGDKLSPDTARILKLLGYEMAEFRIRILSAWSQDGSFVNLQSDSCDPESKENVTSPQNSFMKEDFQLVNDCLLLGDDDEMEVAEDNSEDKNKISNHSKKEREFENPAGPEKVEVVKLQTPNENEFFIEEKKSDKTQRKDLNKLGDNEEKEVAEYDSEDKSKISNHPEKEREFENPTDPEKIEVVKLQTPNEKELFTKGKKSAKKPRKSLNRQAVEETDEQSNEEIDDNEKVFKDELVDSTTILKITEKKLEESVEKPKKFSPKMTRARAAATNQKIKTPESIEIKRSSRKRKM